jgi:zinc protease
MKRLILGLVVMLSSSALSQTSRAESPVPAVAFEPIRFERDVLDNGLRVIYAKLENAPVVHVRVLYHVGSKDEAADRNGFAHMFEHMMFRGSANVKSEQHMKLIQAVGGSSNAFTSFDQTTYVNTVPNNHLEMALWLEADRLASFKVSQPVLETERQVVKEEWRLRYANPPYGPMNSELFAMAFKTHNYKWLPIGDMDQLARSTVQELQDFHDTYYIPNNACLIIAGDFDVARAREWVKKYYGWIPRGDDISRVTSPEPVQTELREHTVYKPNVPITMTTMLYKSPEYRNDDHLAIELLTTILGGGRSSRLYESLVANDPICAGVQMGNYQLEHPSAIICGFRMLPGKEPADALARIKSVFAKVIADGITTEELDKARTQLRVQLVQSRQTAESVASSLGEEEVFGGDANRVNEVFAKLDAVTVDQLKAVAAKYLVDNQLSIISYRPTAEKKKETESSRSSTDAATLVGMKAEASTEPAAETAAPATQPVAVSRRNNVFPSDYPRQPPMDTSALTAEFEKGSVTEVNGVKLITMTDRRLPVVSAQLILRGGSHTVPADKEGVASLTAAMLNRGAAGMTATQIAADLESRGISVNASDDGDVTRLTAFGMVDQIDHAVLRMHQFLLQPDFPVDEFNKLKQQSMTGLMQSLSNPGDVADRELDRVLFGDSPLGKNVTPESLKSVSIDDVKAYYASNYKPDNAILLFAGAIDETQSKALATTLLEGFQPGAAPNATYTLPAVPEKAKIILVNNAEGAQAVVRMGILSYSLKSEDRFAGSVAGQILSSGIDSRLNLELRAKRGLTYGSYGYFRPNRNAGAFELSVETRPEKVGEAITAAFEVLEKMRADDVTIDEMNESKQRVAGSMVLETQTIQQQAGRRVDTILNGWPVDYYDNYAKRIAQVTQADVRGVMNNYVRPGQMSIVVVAPVDQVKAQLEAIGEVVVIDMPLANQQGGFNLGNLLKGKSPTSQPN